MGLRRGKAAFFSGCKSHPAFIAPTRSNRSSHGGGEMAEPFDIACREWMSLDFRFGSRLCQNDFLEAETKHKIEKLAFAATMIRPRDLPDSIVAQLVSVSTF
jgi:hypothetical protein